MVSFEAGPDDTLMRVFINSLFGGTVAFLIGVEILASVFFSNVNVSDCVTNVSDGVKPQRPQTNPGMRISGTGTVRTLVSARSRVGNVTMAQAFFCLAG